MTYQELKHDFMQSEITRLSDKYQLFFAFSDKQLAEGKAKHNISDDEPLGTVLGGGIIPKKDKKNMNYRIEMQKNTEIEGDWYILRVFDGSEIIMSTTDSLLELLDQAKYWLTTNDLTF